MAHQWPTEPRKKQLLLQRLKDKYKRLFGPEHLEEDMIEILRPTIAAGQYHVQRIVMDYEAPKTAQQLKIEAQYERQKSALITQYKVEPTFTIPDTIMAVPVVDNPNEQGEILACTTENAQTPEDTPVNQPEGSEVELEIMIDPEEKQGIEGTEDTPPIVTVISNRERKRLLWLSKIPKKI